MVTIRSSNEIILSLIDFLKIAQPDLDTKPGTVARDIFIDAPASIGAILYSELSSVSSEQSLRYVVGQSLDKIAKNNGLVRRQATSASGIALLTFSSLPANVNINAGGTVNSSNGVSFSVVNGITVSAASSNFYKSVAAKFRDQLDTVGISDQYAVEVTVLANSSGTSSNIGKYYLNKTSISGISNVTNINSFTGGQEQENDTSFRNRILSAYGGSSTGTALGYLNAALGTSGVSDAFVIEPGDSLMTRDGTEVTVATDGTRTIVSEGAGGKVDVAILGTNLIENTDTFIYKDKSNSKDPTNSKNNIVLGQISGDENKTVKTRRRENIKNLILPEQPVNQLIEVSGSISGTNFAEKTTDTLGRTFGNYEIIKDTGVYGGSPWGFDTFHWISDHVSDFSEDKVKGLFNGQDNVTFTDVSSINKIEQSIPIINENSTVTSDRSIIQLLHTPVTNVTRVFNTNTGERYIVSNQNLDATGIYNTTGRIKISGNTLPSTSTQLQVDYSWIVDYDSTSDFDNLSNDNIRSVTDSVDWGLSSNIKKENILFTKDASGNIFNGTASHSISTISSVNKFTEVDGVVALVTTGLFVNRMSVVLSNLVINPTTVDSITFKNSNIECYDTASANGSFTSTTTLFGIQILYNVTIILPTDTTAVNNDKVTVFLDTTDVYHTSTSEGSNNGTRISIPSSLVDTTASNIVLQANYIANVSELISTSTTLLPTSRYGNGYLLSNNNGFTNFSNVNVSRRENQVVKLNLSSQLYVELNLDSDDYAFTADQVVSVIRLSDGYQLWTEANPGTVTIGSSTNFQLLLPTALVPVLNDRVLVVYYANDLRRFQPFSYSNSVFSKKLLSLTLDGSGKLTVPLNKFVTQASGLTFKVIDPNTDISNATIVDGYMTASTSTAAISSLSFNFATIASFTNKKVKILGATDPNNDGVYDIVSYSSSTNLITIANKVDKIVADQISIIKLNDAQEVWTSSGTINVTDNKLLLPTSTAAVNDKVLVTLFNFKSLRKSPTKIISTTIDQTINSGVVTISGTTISKSKDIIFTATSSGLKLNIAEAVRKALSLSSVTSIPSTINLVKIVKVEKVVTASASSDEVLSTSVIYDVKNSTIKSNLLFNENIANSSYQNLDFLLPSTANNLASLPVIGDKIRITFYYTTDSDTENLLYTRNGTLYTNKKFAFINRVYISSGFTSSQSTTITLSEFTQPGLGSRYKVYYDYLAPKQNERISVRYNYNKLVHDVTFNIEATRPVNADILIRAAKKVLLDLVLNIVLDPSYASSKATVIQNVKDKLIAALTSNTLNTIVDTPTLINVAQGVAGVARARILYFNKNGGVGQVSKIESQNDEYFVSNNVVINDEYR